MAAARVAASARYARLRILPFGGLEVVIPDRFPRNLVAGLVAEHADWARRQLARQARLRESISLPSELRLAFDGSTTAIRYRSALQHAQGELFTTLQTRCIEIEAGTNARPAPSCATGYDSARDGFCHLYSQAVSRKPGWLTTG